MNFEHDARSAARETTENTEANPFSAADILDHRLRQEDRSKPGQSGQFEDALSKELSNSPALPALSRAWAFENLGKLSTDGDNAISKEELAAVAENPYQNSVHRLLAARVEQDFDSLLRGNHDGQNSELTRGDLYRGTRLAQMDSQRASELEREQARERPDLDGDRFKGLNLGFFKLGVKHHSLDVGVNVGIAKADAMLGQKTGVQARVGAGKIGARGGAGVEFKHDGLHADVGAGARLTDAIGAGADVGATVGQRIGVKADGGANVLNARTRGGVDAGLSPEKGLHAGYDVDGRVGKIVGAGSRGGVNLSDNSRVGADARVSLGRTSLGAGAGVDTRHDTVIRPNVRVGGSDGESKGRVELAAQLGPRPDVSVDAGYRARNLKTGQESNGKAIASIGADGINLKTVSHPDRHASHERLQSEAREHGHDRRVAESREDHHQNLRARHAAERLPQPAPAPVRRAEVQPPAHEKVAPAPEPVIIHPRAERREHDAERHEPARHESERHEDRFHGLNLGFIKLGFRHHSLDLGVNIGIAKADAMIGQKTGVQARVGAGNIGARGGAGLEFRRDGLHADVGAGARLTRAIGVGTDVGATVGKEIGVKVDGGANVLTARANGDVGAGLSPEKGLHTDYGAHAGIDKIVGAGSKGGFSLSDNSRVGADAGVSLGPTSLSAGAGVETHHDTVIRPNVRIGASDGHDKGRAELGAQVGPGADVSVDARYRSRDLTTGKTRSGDVTAGFGANGFGYRTVSERDDKESVWQDGTGQYDSW